MTKRIAIELYGLTRTYKAAFDSFFVNVIQANYQDDYIIDVFMHTWNETDSSDVTWHNQNGETRGQQLNNTYYDDLINKYHPKGILVDEPINIKCNLIIKENLKDFTRSYSSIISCFYSRFKVNEIRKNYEKEHNIKYDWVLMTRFDIQFNAPFKINDFLKTFEIYNYPLKKDAIYTASAPFKRGMIEMEDFLCCSDLILFASPKTMDKITSFYEDMKEGIITPQFICDNIYGLEILWIKYWHFKNLEYIKIKYQESIDYEIIRSLNCQENMLLSYNNSRKSLSLRFKSVFSNLNLFFKPVFSWFSSIFSILYYLFAAIKKITRRVRDCL